MSCVIGNASTGGEQLPVVALAVIIAVVIVVVITAVNIVVAIVLKRRRLRSARFDTSLFIS